MVKKQAAEVTVETPQKSHGLKRFAIKLAAAVVIVGAGYGMWKNPALIEQVRSAFERQPKEDVYQRQLDALTARMQRLQQQMAAVSSQAMREPDLSAIEEKISGIEKMNLNVIDSKADVATVLGVVTRMDKAEQKLDKLSAVTDESALILTGVMLVKDSAERGGSFEYEVEVLSNIVGDNPKMKEKTARLENFAKDGIVPERQLSKEFAAIYASLLKKQKKDFDKTWKERLNSKLNEIVQIKRVNAEAPEFSADKGLQQVLQLVEEGNLTKAAAELEQPQNAEWMKDAELQEWVAKVKNRDDFYDIIRSMSASSLAVMKVKFLKKN